jgi:ribosome-associated toxin RatA of RatAB toxin-antitoxin module
VRSSLGIDIAAPPELVFALARDVTRWDRVLPHYARSRLVRRDGDVRVCDFIARRPLLPLLGLGLPVAWRSRTWDEPVTCRLRFVHIAGATRGMDVTWTIEPHGDGCRVEITHAFAPAVPLFAALVDGFFTRPIAGRTLSTFKALAEALAETSVSPPSTKRSS